MLCIWEKNSNLHKTGEPEAYSVSLFPPWLIIQPFYFPPFFFLSTDSDEDSELEEEAENITKKKKNLDEFKLPEERKLEEARMARLAVSLV